MTETQREGLEKSIKVWEERLASLSDTNIGSRPGRHTCPLCHLYNTNEHATDGTDCDGCPIYQTTFEKSCEATPFHDCYTIHTMRSIGKSSLDAQRNAYISMINFLKTIRD